MGEKGTFSSGLYGGSIAGGLNYAIGSSNTILATTLGIRFLGQFTEGLEYNNVRVPLSLNMDDIFISVAILF